MMERKKNADVIPNADNKRKPMKSQLSKLAENYSNSFTIHGLSRVFTGNRIERVIWSLALLLGFAISITTVYSLLRKYQSKQVFIETRTNVVTEITFPLITICKHRDKTMKNSYDEWSPPNSILIHKINMQLKLDI